MGLKYIIIYLIISSDNSYQLYKLKENFDIEYGNNDILFSKININDFYDILIKKLIELLNYITNSDKFNILFINNNLLMIEHRKKWHMYNYRYQFYNNDINLYTQKKWTM